MDGLLDKNGQIVGSMRPSTYNPTKTKMKGKRNKKIKWMYQ